MTEAELPAEAELSLEMTEAEFCQRQSEEKLYRGLTEEEAYRGLCAAILLAAVRDWRRTLTNCQFFVPSQTDAEPFLVSREELREFFNSDWFNFLCDEVEMNPTRILERLYVKRSDGAYWREKHNARRRMRRKAKRMAALAQKFLDITRADVLE